MTWPRRSLFILLLGVLTFGVNQALYHPDTPLPAEWNPTAPFRVSDPLSPLTDWKIAGVMAQDGACEAALAPYSQSQDLPPLEVSDTCGIAQRVQLSSVGRARLRPVETTCEIALRLALWERHGLQPAAQAAFGAGVAEIRHLSSYNCRRMRTSDGQSDRWSTHATARAIDVSGFVLTSGEIIHLKEHWSDPGPKGNFLREAQQTACDAFGLVLGPEFNALHADHFHIQLDWQGCR